MQTHNLDHVELTPGEPGTIRTTITPQADAVRPLPPSLPDEAQDFVDLTAELLAMRIERDTLQTIASNACLRIVGLALIVEDLQRQLATVRELRDFDAELIADLRRQLAEPHPSECGAS